MATIPDQMKKALGLPHHESHARLNLEGALYDLERQGADHVCLGTIRRVCAQLAKVETIIEREAT